MPVMPYIRDLSFKEIQATLSSAFRLVIPGFMLLLFIALSQDDFKIKLFVTYNNSLRIALFAIIGIILGISIHSVYRVVLSAIELCLFTTSLTAVNNFRISRCSIAQRWASFLKHRYASEEIKKKDILFSYLNYRWSLCHLCLQISSCLLLVVVFSKSKHSYISNHSTQLLVGCLIVLIFGLFQLLFLYRTEAHIVK